MREQPRFDPLGWFVSASMTLLFGTVALTAAIYLIQAIWVWLVLAISLIVGTAMLVQGLLWWSRRRSW